MFKQQLCCCYWSPSSWSAPSPTAGRCQSAAGPPPGPPREPHGPSPRSSSPPVNQSINQYINQSSRCLSGIALISDYFDADWMILIDWLVDWLINWLIDERLSHSFTLLVIRERPKTLIPQWVAMTTSGAVLIPGGDDMWNTWQPHSEVTKQQ